MGMSRPETTLSHEDLFIIAVKNGNIKEFDKLINIVDINHQDHLGNTALHYAAMRPSHQKIEEGSEDNRILMLEKLLGHDKLNTDLKNLNNNGFKEIIEKNQESNNENDHEYGNRCNDVLKKMGMSKPETILEGRFSCRRRPRQDGEG